MQIQVTYFAQIRKAAGTETETLELPDGADVLASIKAAAAGHNEDFRKLVLAPDGKPNANLIMLINETPASGPAHLLKAGDKVAFFSPVAGG